MFSVLAISRRRVPMKKPKQEFDLFERNSVA
jgi:hypothetical protein